MIGYDKDKKTLELKILAVPRASKTELKGEHDGALRVRIAAPPVDGAANEELVKYFSKLFGVARSRVVVSSGTASRKKILRVSEVSAKEALEIKKKLV